MDKRIVLYSTGCPKCSVLKKKMDAAHIVYVEEHDMDEMLKVGLKSAPGLMVGSEILNFQDAVRWVQNYVSERTPSD
jgi:hypothetical protein